MEAFNRVMGSVMGMFSFGDLANRAQNGLPRTGSKRHGGVDVGVPGCHLDVPPGRSTPAGSGPRVLVVDDNPVNRMLASEMLALWGIEPLLAVDGNEAVTLACEVPLALILMDLQMPLLDGLGATRQIRRFELERSRPRVPIVAFTSKDQKVNRLHLLTLVIAVAALTACGRKEEMPAPAAAPTPVANAASAAVTESVEAAKAIGNAASAAAIATGDAASAAVRAAVETAKNAAASVKKEMKRGY